MTKISITGHRKLLNESEVRSEIALKLKNYKETYKDLHAVSALAEGADTIFAEEAIKLGIPVSFVLPFSLEEYRKDFSAEGQVVLEKLIENNGNKYEVVINQQVNTKDGRNKAYLGVGKKLVDTTDILMAVWDGQSAHGEGGTGDIVNYAIKQGKIINIIKALRPNMEAKSSFYDAYQKYDNDAVSQKRVFDLFFWKGGIISGVLAVFTFSVSVSFAKYLSEEWKGLILPILEALFVIVSFVFLGFFAPNAKPKFLGKRHFAEYLRVHDFMVNCGFAMEKNRKNHEKYPRPLDVTELEEKYVDENKTNLSLEERKAKLIEFIKDQNKYHTETRIKGYKRKEHLFELSLKCILWFFALVVVAKLIFELMEYCGNTFIHHHPSILAWCKFFIILLPPSYAAIEGLIYLSEWKRNIQISEALNEKYNNLQSRIEACKDTKTLEELGQELDDTFWTEQCDWLAWFHNKKIEPRV